MSGFTQGNVPGFKSQIEATDAQVWWSGRQGQSLIATRPVVLDSSNTDGNNTPETTLAAGNILSLDDGGGNAYLYDADANDGTQIAAGVLEQSLDMLEDGTATERFTQMLVAGLLKGEELAGLDPRARTQLAGRFVFDDPLEPVGVLMHPRGVYRKSENYDVTAADNGLMFIATAAVNFALPTKQNGLAFRFVQSSDSNLVITGAGDLVHKNSATATTVSFQTPSERLGSQVLVECVYTAEETLKWIVSNLGGTTATVA